MLIITTLSTNPEREEQARGVTGVLEITAEHRVRTVDTQHPYDAWNTVELRLTVEQAQALVERLTQDISFAQ